MTHVDTDEVEPSTAAESMLPWRRSALDDHPIFSPSASYGPPNQLLFTHQELEEALREPKQADADVTGLEMGAVNQGLRESLRSLIVAYSYHTEMRRFYPFCS